MKPVTIYPGDDDRKDDREVVRRPLSDSDTKTLARHASVGKTRRKSVLPDTLGDIKMMPVSKAAVSKVNNSEVGAGGQQPAARRRSLMGPIFTPAPTAAPAEEPDMQRGTSNVSVERETSESLKVYHSEGAKRASMRFLCVKFCCKCLFPEELIHKVDQNVQGFTKHTANLEAGDTLIHHYKPDEFRSKYSMGADVFIDEQGNKIEVKDTKKPTEEEMRLYQLRAVSDATEIYSQRSSSGNPMDTSSGEIIRRRLTFSRAELEEAGSSTDSRSSISDTRENLKMRRRILKGPTSRKVAYGKAEKPKKSVRVFPIVRVTMIDNFHNVDVEDWDHDTNDNILRPMKRGDLWYTRRDISMFRKILKHDDVEHSLANLRRRSKNALVWFQTFGKFFGECGDPFTEEHEKTIFGKPIAEYMDFDDIFYDDTLDLLNEVGPPIEYKSWESGEYFLHKKAHSSLVFSSLDAVPTHASFNSLQGRKGIETTVSSRVMRLGSISENMQISSSMTLMDHQKEGLDSSSSFSSSSDDEAEDESDRDSGVKEIIEDYDDQDSSYHNEIVRRSSSAVKMGTGGIRQQQSLLATMRAGLEGENTGKEEKPEKVKSTPDSPPFLSCSPPRYLSRSRKTSSVDKFLNLEDDVDTKAIGGGSLKSIPLSPESTARSRKFRHRDQSIANLLSDEKMNSAVSPSSRMAKTIEVKMDTEGGALKIIQPGEIARSDSDAAGHQKKLLRMQSSQELSASRIRTASSDTNLPKGKRPTF